MVDRNSMDVVMERMDGFLDILDTVPRAAHARYRAYKIEDIMEHTGRTQANCIYDHMVAEAVRKLAGNSVIKQIDVRGLKLWTFEDHTIVRWKKMDEDGSTRNYPTKQAKDFDYMKELEGVPPKPTRISVGYFLDATALQVQRVQVARPNGRRVDWCAAIVPAENRAAGGRKWEAVTKQSRFG